MNGPKDEKWLDERLFEAIDSGKPTFDAEKWKQKFPQEYEILTSRAGRATVPSHGPKNIWRIIMKTNMRKLTTVAAAIIIVALAITFVEKTTTPAWAIEQTVEALEQFNGIYISGTVGVSLAELGGHSDKVLAGDEKMSIEIWAQANEQRTRSGNIRMETSDGSIGAVYKNTTYKYNAKSNFVEIKQGQEVQLSPWPSGDFLLKMQEYMEDWQVLYGKDAATGQELAIITCSNPSQRQSWRLEIDLQTNLPVRVKGWNNTRHEGTPSIDFQRITFFNDLPDDMFKFEIPEGAEVVDLSEQFAQILKDPSYGISAEGLIKEKACKIIVEEYWKAMIGEDWEKAQKLRSIPEGQIWEDWKAQYIENMPVEIIEIGDPYSENDYNVVSMTIRMADGAVKNGKLMVKFRELDSVKSCIIIGNYGPRELNYSE